MKKKITLETDSPEVLELAILRGIKYEEELCQMAQRREDVPGMAKDCEKHIHVLRKSLEAIREAL